MWREDSEPNLTQGGEDAGRDGRTVSIEEERTEKKEDSGAGDLPRLVGSKAQEGADSNKEGEVEQGERGRGVRETAPEAKPRSSPNEVKDLVSV